MPLHDIRIPVTFGISPIEQPLHPRQDRTTEILRGGVADAWPQAIKDALAQAPYSTVRGVALLRIEKAHLIVWVAVLANDTLYFRNKCLNML